MSQKELIKQLAINGNDLIELGYEDKKIGEMLNTLLNIVIDDNYLNNKESLLNVINNLNHSFGYFPYNIENSKLLISLLGPELRVAYELLDKNILFLLYNPLFLALTL